MKAKVKLKPNLKIATIVFKTTTPNFIQKLMNINSKVNAKQGSMYNIMFYLIKCVRILKRDSDKMKCRYNHQNLIHVL